MKKTFLTLTTAIAMTLAAGTAMANVSKDTAKFVKEASLGSQFEIESSKLALDRSTNPEIRAFAQQMIDDHTAAAAGLEKAMADSKIDAAIKPAALDEKHVKILDELRNEDVKDFDEEYAEAQKKAHRKTVNLFEDYAKDGEDPALKSFATNTLATLKSHKDMAKTLESKVD